MRRSLRFLLPAVAAAGILLLFVLPARTFVNQAHSLAATERRAAELSSENAKLQAEAKQLQSAGRIEQIARQDYGLVMPGQRAYAVIPAGTTTTTLPAAGAAGGSSRPAG